MSSELPHPEIENKHKSRLPRWVARPAAAAMILASNYLPDINFNIIRPNLTAAPKANPAFQVDLPQVDIQVGEYQTIKGISSDGKEVELTQIYRGSGINKIQVQLFLDSYGSFEEGKAAAKRELPNFFRLYEKYKDIYDVWVRNPVGMENLQCDLFAVCQPGPYRREIDRTISATRFIPLETYVLIHSKNSRGTGQTISIDVLRDLPSVYDFTGLIVPDNYEAEAEKLNWTHESGHRKGFRHEIGGGNRTLRPGYPNCSESPQESFGWIPTPYKECEGDSQAYRPCETSIMRELVPILCAFHENWIARILNSPNRKARYDFSPELKITAYGASSTENKVVQAQDMSMEMDWQFPATTTQLHITGVPGDGPSVNLIMNPTTKFKVEAPQIGVGNYTLQEGQIYTWNLESHSLDHSLEVGDPGWHPTVEIWPGQTKTRGSATIKIKTPINPQNVTAISPRNGETGVSIQPLLRWGNSDLNAYYYEVRLSSDCTFNMDPNTASTSVYWMLRHGGLSNPINSWIPPELQPGTTYCWGVRQRMQGGAPEAAWSNFTFTTTGGVLKGN